MSLFFLGKSPLEDVPTSGYVRHNQAKSSLEVPKRSLLERRSHKSEKVHQRKLASKNWKFYNMDEEQQHHDEGVYLNEPVGDQSINPFGSLTARERKSVAQLKSERVLKQQVLFQEIEHNIREKRDAEEGFHPSVSPIAKDNRFAISETMSNVLAKHREKFGHKQNEVEEILRERDVKLYTAAAGVDNTIVEQRRTSLPRISKRQEGSSRSSSNSNNRSTPSLENDTLDDTIPGVSGTFSFDACDDFIPSYSSLHPLEQEMRETIDFPADLVDDEELYIEDSDYLDYKKRLDNGRDSSEEEEDVRIRSRSIQEQDFLARKRKAQNFGQRWFLPPSQWSIDTDSKNKKIREKHNHSEKEMKEKLKNLSSSKLFKVHLIKTNNTVPDWLAECNIKNQHPLLSMDYDKSSQSLIPPIIKNMHDANLLPLMN